MMGWPVDEIVPVMGRILKGDDQRDAYSASYVLIDCGPRAAPALPDIIAAYGKHDSGSDKDDDPAMMVLEAMGQAAEPAWEKLAKTFRDGVQHRDVRAVWIMEAINLPRARWELIDVARHHSDGARRKDARFFLDNDFPIGEAANWLPAALPLFIRDLHDADKNLVWKAALVVAAVGSPPPALIARLKASVRAKVPGSSTLAGMMAWWDQEGTDQLIQWAREHEADAMAVFLAALPADGDDWTTRAFIEGSAELLSYAALRPRADAAMKWLRRVVDRHGNGEVRELARLRMREVGE